jgi:hypothetical protein
VLILEIGCLEDLLIEWMLFLGVCRVGDRGSVEFSGAPLISWPVASNHI